MPQNQSVSKPRVVAVTGGLIASGAVVGGGLGSSLLAMLGLLIDGVGGFPFVWDAYVIAAVVGAVFGGIGVPLIAWSGLREVPLARIFVRTTVGTVIGGTVGLLAFSLNPVTAVVGAVAGFVGAALSMRTRTAAIGQGGPVV